MIVQQSILFDKISTQFISFFNYALICFFLRNFYSHTSLQSATPTRLSINTLIIPGLFEPPVRTLRFFRNYPFLNFPTYLSFASNNCFLQRPYIVRFIIFNLLFVPSTKPLL